MSVAGPAAPPSKRRAALIRFVAFPAAVAVSVLGVMMIFENRLVYFPERASTPFTKPASLRAQDVHLTTAGGVPIHAWWCPKDGADGALLYAHGNGGNLSMLADEYAQLRDALNVSVMAFDYPGYGCSGGSPSEAGCYESALAAFDWLTGQGVPAERVILYGDSLGGGVAAEVATRRPCRALVLYSTYTSVPDVGHDQYPFLPVRTLMRNRFETLRKLPAVRRPVFIAHGDADTLIGIAHARRLFDAANEPKNLHIDPGRGHETILTPNLLAALRDFLKRHAP